MNIGYKIIETTEGLAMFGPDVGTANPIEAAIEDGHGYRSYDRLTLTTGTSAYWRIKGHPEKATVIYSRRISSTKPTTLYQVFTGATGVVLGSQVPIWNMNSKSSDNLQGLVHRVTSVGGEGTGFDFDQIVGSIVEGGAITGANGGSSYDPHEIRIFPPGYERLLKITNNSADTADVTFYLKWLEMVDELI